MKNYIGIASTFHDSAISVVDGNGKVVFAEATERYMQNKRSINVPADVLVRIAEIIEQYCDPNGEIIVAHSWSDQAQKLIKEQYSSTMTLEERYLKSLGYIPSYINGFIQLGKYTSHSQTNMLNQVGMTLEYELNINPKLKKYNKKIETRKYDHHRAHAAAACYSSNLESGVCAIVDGYGESVASKVFVYKDGKIEEVEIDNSTNTASLGFFYTFICETCGFGQLTGEEWKIMGLAPYGKFNQEMYDLLKSIIRVNGLGFEWKMENMITFFSELETLRRKDDEPPIAAADLAYNGQVVYQELLFEYLDNVYQYAKENYGAELASNLILGGGCALNSSANGKIVDNTKFAKLFVYSAPGDDGNAVGAALLAFYEDHKDAKPDFENVQSPYLGSELSKEKLEYFLKFSGLKTIKVCPVNICEEAAKLLSEGKIIAWVQGKAEFGPRALGNRSILADPRSPKMKDMINAKVKFREEFRPFAPSILSEFGEEYFENYQETPYMERTLQFKDEVKHNAPAVVHFNGTGRLQTVKKEWNEKYYNLIHEFYKITGVPIVLNTSLNIMGKPIVHSVEDVISLLYTCGLDAAVLGDILIIKE